MRLRGSFCRRGAAWEVGEAMQVNHWLALVFLLTSPAFSPVRLALLFLTMCECGMLCHALHSHLRSPLFAHLISTPHRGRLPLWHRWQVLSRTYSSMDRQPPYMLLYPSSYMLLCAYSSPPAEVAFLCGIAELWTVRTLQTCRLLSIPRNGYRSLSRAHPSDDRQVVANLLQR